MPSPSLCPPDPPTAITTTPVNATAMPITSGRGNPSFMNSPASTATTIGAKLTSSAAVPASRCRSAALRTAV
jgi:hypothetical protein